MIILLLKSKGFKKTTPYGKVKNGICLDDECLEKNVFQYCCANQEKHYHILTKRKNKKCQDKYENTYGIFK